MKKGTWIDVYPKSSISETGQIQLEFERKQQELLDLSHRLLYVTMQLVKSDGSELDGGTKVGPVNLFHHSLFEQLDITLNVRTLSDGSSTYPYRVYLGTFLSFEDKAKSTHLTSPISLFCKDWSDG